MYIRNQYTTINRNYVSNKTQPTDANVELETNI